MELPPFDLEFFNKWKQSNSIVKECDMDEQTLMDAKDHVVTGIEKMSSAEGIDFTAAARYVKESMDR
tara:strand:+ start:177 stop:377 length:201 start_codon:yes stop_codon:yes gene_type:complete